MNTQDFKKGMPMNPHWNIDTKLVHAGERGEVLPGIPTVHPISMSNTYIAPLATMDAILGGAPGYTYGRHHNPSVDALAEAVRELEEGEVAFAYASGMAAVHASLMALSLRPGDRVLLSRDLYGASLNLVEQLFAPMGIDAIEEDLTDLDRVNQVFIRYRPRLVLFELISNPLLRLVDGPALTQMAHQHQARVIIDNTFTTPLMAKPLSYGADFVVHSATKYLGGHGDAIGGILVTRREHQDRLYSQQKLMGTILGPFEAWLIHRGLKTLGLRFPRQCQNASQLALRLHQSGRFKQVHYPGLTHHPRIPSSPNGFPPRIARRRGDPGSAWGQSDGLQISRSPSISGSCHHGRRHIHFSAVPAHRFTPFSVCRGSASDGDFRRNGSDRGRHRIGRRHCRRYSCGGGLVMKHSETLAHHLVGPYPFQPPSYRHQTISRPERATLSAPDRGQFAAEHARHLIATIALGKINTLDPSRFD